MDRLSFKDDQQNLQPLRTWRSGQPYGDNAEGQLCIVVGGCGPQSPVPFIALSLDIAVRSPLRKKGCCCLFWVFFFFSIYLEIKAADPTSGFTSGALENGSVS